MSLIFSTFITKMIEYTYGTYKCNMYTSSYLDIGTADTVENNIDD